MKSKDLQYVHQQWAQYLHENDLVREHINEMTIRKGLIEERIKQGGYKQLR
jgi:hypothetical protein